MIAHVLGNFRPLTHRMREDFPHNAGAAGHPHLEHDKPQEGLHRIGTNAHPARDLLAGEAQHQQLRRFLLPRRQAELLGYLRSIEVPLSDSFEQESRVRFRRTG